MENFKFDRLNEKIQTHDKILDNHDKRLDVLERETTKFEVRLENLIKQLEELNKTMKWFIGVLVGALVSFFFYGVQQILF